jgi:ATP-dependent DNA helicase RecQ
VGKGIEEAREVLREHWGYAGFRSGQEQAIEGVLAMRDTLTVMPTGGGKSLCFQVPALMLPGVTVVVSPLISLMKDQVDALNRLGLPATFVNSSLGLDEIGSRMAAVERGEVKLVYVAPERFDSPAFQERIGRCTVSLLAVDEAHCISQWGHDFRPSYLRIGAVRRQLGDPPVAALTATATPEVRRDIERQLELRDPQVLVAGFDRRNLSWHVLRAKNDSEKDRLLLRLLRGRDGAAVVYASTRKNVDAITALLRGVGVPAVGYHAGLSDSDRKRLQDVFMNDEAQVVVATNAFGMGIDKSNVRLVAHYNMPGSLEAYYQEGGRAGRDGGPADCVLLHAYADRFTHEFFIEQNFPPRPVIERALKELRARADRDGWVAGDLLPEVARAVEPKKGGRQLQSALRILEDYGLARSAGGSQGPVRVRLIATPKRISRELGVGGRERELALLRRLWRLAGGEVAYEGVELERSSLAKGAGSPDALARLLDGLQKQGFLSWSPVLEGDGVQVLDADTPLARLRIDWQAVEMRRRREDRRLQQMQGYVYHEGCRRGYVLRYFGDADAMDHCGACDNCREPGPIQALAPAPAEKRDARRAAPAARRAAPAPAEPAALRPADLEVFERLRALRGGLAREAGLPAYCVFPDRTLRELAARRPRSEEELLEVPGVGPARLERWGGAFLELLQEEKE